MNPAPALTRLALVAALTLGGIGTATPQTRSDDAVGISTTAVHWTLDGPFALREVEVVLRNPHDRALETTVRVPLAANERLRGYALDVDGAMRDAVPVERVQARVAFEETARRQVDPAVAQKDAGNSYSIRVFPVPAHGERRLRLTIASLATRDACGWNHRLPAGLPGGGSAPGSIDVSDMPAHGDDGGLAWTRQSNGHFIARIGNAGTSRERSVCLPAPAGDAAFTTTFDDGLQMRWLEVPAPRSAPTRPVAFPSRIELVWDASYSQRTVDRHAELALLARYLRGHRVELTVSILRETVQRRQVSLQTPADLDRLIASLLAEPADGATALADWSADPKAQQILLFSDAVATLPGAMQPTIRAPLFVIAPTIGDPALARWLTRSGGQVLDLATLGSERALRALRGTPALQARLGPLDDDWHLEQYAVDAGALRGCHVTHASDDAPSLTLVQATPDGLATRRHPANGTRSSSLAAFWCAVWQAEDLEARPDANRTALAALGERFGVPNRETSLLVLERDADYLRYGILPPQADVALRERIERARAEAAADKAERWAANLDAVRRGWQARIEWWNTHFPKGAPPQEKAAASVTAPLASMAATGTSAPPPRPAPAVEAAPSPPPPPAPADSQMARRAESAVALQAPGTVAPASQPAIGMQLQAVTMDAPYVADLRGATDAAALYARYLDLRLQYGQSPAFLFDVAQRLFELGDARRGWRVLSAIVELLPNEPSALRLVAYRLQEAGLQAPALALLRRIVVLAPDEPQSFRDLALALRAPSTCDEAMGLLDHVVRTPWDARFADIGIIALAERNDLRIRCPAASAPARGDDTALPLPVGLRVVLRWDLNDTDIDLHVTDPNDEEVYYAHRASYQGGALSRDFTGGYGPEEFILRDPKPGVYKVSVVYFGSRLARLSRGVILNVTLQTGFGTSELREQTVSMRLLEKTGNVLVGSFTVAPSGTLRIAPAADSAPGGTRE